MISDELDDKPTFESLKSGRLLLGDPLVAGSSSNSLFKGDEMGSIGYLKGKIICAIVKPESNSKHNHPSECEMQQLLSNKSLVLGLVEKN